MNLRILMISNAAPSKQHPYSGIFINNLINGLIEHGHNVSWVKITKDLKKYRIVKVVKYIYLFIKSIIFTVSNDYDIIHIHFVSHTGLLGLLLKKLKNIPLVINFHGTDLKPYSVNPIQMIISNADMLISPSSIFYEKLKTYYSIDIPVCIYPSGGIDCELFDNHYNKKKTYEFHIGYISRITKEKGIWDFISAIEKLYGSGKKIIAHIIGTGPEYEHVNDYVNNRNLKDKITFRLYGSINQKKLPIIYNKFDVFIFSTRRTESESLGLVALESLACGVPVIGTDIPVTNLYIKDGYNGFIYKKGNIDSLVQCLENYLKLDKNQRKRMQINAREMAFNFEKNKVNEELIYSYSRILRK